MITIILTLEPYKVREEITKSNSLIINKYIYQMTLEWLSSDYSNMQSSHMKTHTVENDIK